MFQLVVISLNPALLSFLRSYCQQENSRWQFRAFPTIGSFVTAKHEFAHIDLFFFDAYDVYGGLEEQRITCLMAPLALRVVVTNTEHDDVVLAHLDHFHAFIGTSVDFEHLQQLFQNAERLHQLPLTPISRRLLSALIHFPVYPAVSRQFRALVQDPAVDVGRIAKLLEQDPVVLSRLLQLVNSPYMGFISGTLSLETAINRLGLQVVEGLVFMLAIKGRTAELLANEHAAVIDRSVQFAARCRSLAKSSQLKRVVQDHVFIAAMLSGFGQLILLQHGWMPDDPQLCPAAADEPSPVVLISAYLLTLWGFEQHVINPLLQQHQFIERSDDESQVSNCLFLARLTSEGLHQLTLEQRAQIRFSVFADAVGLPKE